MRPFYSKPSVPETENDVIELTPATVTRKDQGAEKKKLRVSRSRVLLPKNTQRNRGASKLGIIGSPTALGNEPYSAEGKSA